MADAEFVNGLIVKAPRDNAPAFVKASISIKVAELGMWLREKHKAGEEWVNIDVKESKGGKWYAAVSTRRSGGSSSGSGGSSQPQKSSDPDGDIPF